MYKSIIKYIFSERTINSQFIDMYFIDFNINSKCIDRFNKCVVSVSYFSEKKNRVNFSNVFCFYLKRRFKTIYSKKSMIHVYINMIIVNSTMHANEVNVSH